MTTLVLAGCGGSDEPPRPPEVPVTTVEQEGPYEDPLAQRQLGVMYYIGQGIDRDYAMAFELFGQAASKSDGIAQYYLGVMHAEGQSVPRDLTQAHMWLSLSAQQGNSSAQLRLDKLAPEMQPEQIAQARKLAEEWQPGI
jgi:TPR repeat protein